MLYHSGAYKVLQVLQELSPRDKLFTLTRTQYRYKTMMVSNEAVTTLDLLYNLVLLHETITYY